MTRTVPLDPSALTPRQREVYDTISAGPRGGVPGPLAIWLERPELADTAQALGRYCRYDSSLPPRLSELAILLTARHWSAEYEWQAHKQHALAAGLAPAIVDAIRDRTDPPFEAEDEAATHAYATALLRERTVPGPVFARAVAALGRDGVVDLTGVLGYYTLISMTIVAFEVPPIDPDAAEMT